jgi:hypothetical protein
MEFSCSCEQDFCATTRNSDREIEPVSVSKFPANREINREFCEIRSSRVNSTSSQRENSIASSRIPYAMEQGIFFTEQGRIWSEQGNLVRWISDR